MVLPVVIRTALANPVVRKKVVVGLAKTIVLKEILKPVLDDLAPAVRKDLKDRLDGKQKKPMLERQFDEFLKLGIVKEQDRAQFIEEGLK